MVVVVVRGGETRQQEVAVTEDGNYEGDPFGNVAQRQGRVRAE